MTSTIEEISKSHPTSPVNSADTFENIQHHYNANTLDPIDTIYVESSYSYELYNLRLTELVDYAYQADMYLDYPINYNNYFKILRTVIYYRDVGVQQALLDYNTSSKIGCSNVNEAGDIIDPITRRKVNPRRMVTLPFGAEGEEDLELEASEITKEELEEWRTEWKQEEEDIGFQCYDIESYFNAVDSRSILTKYRYMDKLSFEKAWWAAYREDFNLNIPFILDRNKHKKYYKLYESTDNMFKKLARRGIPELLSESDHLAGFIINNVDIDKILVNIGAAEGERINRSFSGGNTLLHWIGKFSRGGTRKNIQRVLEVGADINSQNDQGNTPLIEAAIVQNIPASRLLIAAGANLNIQNKDGATALILAVKHGSLYMVKSLIAGRADPNIQTGWGDGGYTALIYAVQHERLDMVNLLIAARADPNIQTNENDGEYTALIYAAKFGKLDMVDTLIAAGADPNIQTSEDDGKYTALMYAVKDKKLDIVESLLAAGADVNIHGVYNTVLSIASGMWHNIPILNRLLSAGVDPNITNDVGNTALFRAYTEPTKILLQWGADPNIANNFGGTPLIYSAINGIWRKLKYYLR